MPTLIKNIATKERAKAVKEVAAAAAAGVRWPNDTRIPTNIAPPAQAGAITAANAPDLLAGHSRGQPPLPTINLSAGFEQATADQLGLANRMAMQQGVSLLPCATRQAPQATSSCARQTTTTTTTKTSPSLRDTTPLP